MEDGKIVGKRARWIRRYTIALLTVLASICVGLGLVEGLTRLLLPEFDPAGYFFGLKIKVGQFKVGPLTLPSPGTVVRQVKSSGDFDVTIHINRHGLRDEKDVGGATLNDLIVVGDSFAWGWGVEAGNRFSDRIQALADVRTFNISAPGYDLDGYEALLKYAHALGSRAERVVVAVCMENDIMLYGAEPAARKTAFKDALATVATAAPSRLKNNLKNWLAERSAAYLLAATAVRKTPSLIALARWVGLIRPNLEGIILNTYWPEAINSSAVKLQGIAAHYRTLIVLIPSRGLWVGPNRAIEDRVHKAFMAALAQRGVAVLDLRPQFEAGGNPLAFHFSRDGHWNPQGHLRAAKAIVERLRTDGL